MNMLNTIKLTAAVALLLSGLVRLAAAFCRYVELQRWRRAKLRSLQRRRRY